MKEAIKVGIAVSVALAIVVGGCAEEPVETGPAGFGGGSFGWLRPPLPAPVDDGRFTMETYDDTALLAFDQTVYYQGSSFRQTFTAPQDGVLHTVFACFHRMAPATTATIHASATNAQLAGAKTIARTYVRCARGRRARSRGYWHRIALDQPVEFVAETSYTIALASESVMLVRVTLRDTYAGGSHSESGLSLPTGDAVMGFSYGTENICAAEGGCYEGSQRIEACGKCGQRALSCDDACNWDAGSCELQGTCSPGTQTNEGCDNSCQRQTCTGQCELTNTCTACACKEKSVPRSDQCAATHHVSEYTEPLGGKAKVCSPNCGTKYTACGIDDCGRGYFAAGYDRNSVRCRQFAGHNAKATHCKQVVSGTEYTVCGLGGCAEGFYAARFHYAATACAQYVGHTNAKATTCKPIAQGTAYTQCTSDECEDGFLRGSTFVHRPACRQFSTHSNARGYECRPAGNLPIECDRDGTVRCVAGKYAESRDCRSGCLAAGEQCKLGNDVADANSLMCRPIPSSGGFTQCRPRRGKTCPSGFYAAQLSCEDRCTDDDSLCAPGQFPNAVRCERLPASGSYLECARSSCQTGTRVGRICSAKCTTGVCHPDDDPNSVTCSMP